MTVPGVTRPHREHSQFFNSQDSLRFEVNGQPGMASNTLIEGLDDNHKTGLLQVIIPAADALETVSVTTSNYDAEFGRSGGAVTNVTLKSGTNDLKGSVFFFGNNEKTNASDYFTHLKAPTKFVNGGFTLGGPIVKSKLFFFGDYQRTHRQHRLRRPRDRPDAWRCATAISARSPTRIYDPLTGDVNGTGRDAFANNQIPQERISPIARRLLAFDSRAQHRGAALGQNNFQQAQTREKTTDGFDAKINYTVSDKDQLSYRLSFMRPVVFDPGCVRRVRRPGQRRLRRHGHQHQLQHRGDLDARVQRQDGARRARRPELLPQRHVDDRTGPDDQHRRRHSRRQPRRFHQRHLAASTSAATPGPLLGFSASQPWDRSEKTWNAHGDADPAAAARTPSSSAASGATTATCCCRRRTPAARAARFTFNASGTGLPGETAHTQRPRQLRWRRSCSTGRTSCQRDLKVFDDPGTKHWAIVLVRAGQVAGALERHRRPRAALGVLHAARRASKARAACPTTTRTTHTLRVAGFGDHGQRAEREEELQELLAAHRRVLASQRADGGARRLRREHDSVPGQPLRVQLPGEAELRRRPRPTGSSAPARWPPASRRRRCSTFPTTGIVPVTGTALQNATLDVIPTDLHEATLHSWNVAFQRQLPFLLTADIAYVGNRGVDIVMDVDTNASLVYGSGNNGRPQFAQFNRTGANRDAHQRQQVELPRPADEGRPPVPERPAADQLVHAQPRDELREREHQHRHADRLRAELGARRISIGTHNYVLTGVYELPWGPDKRWLSDGAARQDHRRLAGERHLHRAVGHAAEHHRQRHVLNTPGNTAFANLNGDNRVLGGLGPGKLYFDPTVYSLPAAGVQGNMTRNGGPEGPGFWNARRLAVQALQRRRRAATPSSASTPTT